MLSTNGETTMTESLEWQLTTKGWRNRSCSVWSSASPPFFAAEPSAAQQKSRGSAWLLPRGTPRPRPPLPLWLPPPPAPPAPGGALPSPTALIWPGLRHTRLSRGRTVPPWQDASYKARTSEHWQRTTADTQAPSEHYMAQQSQKVILDFNDFRWSCLAAGCPHPLLLTRLQRHVDLLTSGLDDMSKDRKIALFKSKKHACMEERK